MANEQNYFYDEEMRNILITIGMTALRIADRLAQNKKKTEEQENGKIEGNLGCP